MRRSTFITAAVAGIVCSMILASMQPRAIAHCEVPCGIYDDHARVNQMLEDATTIEKAVNQIIELSRKTDALSLNQATRWVTTKDDHANKIQHTTAQYFLTQRVKPVAPGSDGWDAYVALLAEHHAVIVLAMKTKQTADPANVKKLKEAIERVGRHYPAPEHSHG